MLDIYAEPNRLGIRNALALSCASLAVTGCAPAEQPVPELPGIVVDMPAMERCSGNEQLDSLPSAWPRTMPDSAISLHFDPATQKIDSEPELTREQEQRLREANVMIQTANGKGSGFLTTGLNGEALAITAAHVLAGAKLGDIKITDHTGSQVGVAGGCFVYRFNGGEPTVVSDVSVNDWVLDFAILSPEQGLTGNPLKLATEPPERGDWVTFTNSQARHTPQQPAQYAGMVVNPGRLIDGLQAWRYTAREPSALHNGYLRYTTFGGASGGMVTNGSQEVLYVFHSSTGMAMTPTQLKQFGNVVIDAEIGAATNLVPSPNYGTGVDVIAWTISHATNYDRTPASATAGT